MAEETVVKDLLTHDMIVAGEELVRGLDASEYDVVGSLWFYIPESNEWRLMLVSPQLESEGPKKSVYENSIRALQRKNWGRFTTNNCLQP